jgi:hypothetical protein
MFGSKKKQKHLPQNLVEIDEQEQDDVLTPEAVYDAMDAEGWLKSISSFTQSYSEATEMQARAEDLWAAGVHAHDGEIVKQSYDLSQKVAVKYLATSRVAETWLSMNKDEPWSKSETTSRPVWSIAQGALLLQSMALELELLVWERQLNFEDAQAQQLLATFNGHGIGHARYGKLVVEDLEQRSGPVAIEEHREWLKRRMDDCYAMKQRVTREYPMETIYRALKL